MDRQGRQRIFVAAHRGMVGSAICRRLARRDDVALITRTSADLDLTDRAAAGGFMAEARPDAVILAAAKVGGIHSNNTYPADERLVKVAVPYLADSAQLLLAAPSSYARAPVRSSPRGRARSERP